MWVGLVSLGVPTDADETNNIYIHLWTPSVPLKILGDRIFQWRAGYECKRIVAFGGGVIISVVCRVSREESLSEGNIHITICNRSERTSFSGRKKLHCPY